MIIVTGGAGLIGSAVVWSLNNRGEKKILIVDHNPDGTKDDNFKQLNYSGFVDKSDFIEELDRGKYGNNIDAIIHLGACSDTTETDKDYLRENNFLYTQKIATYAIESNIRFIYASSAATYGNGEKGYLDDEKLIATLEPLNEYARSKQMFDLWAWENGFLDKIVGLKYFNVFGPNEDHKGDMQSMVRKSFRQIWANGEVDLFRSYNDDYEDGEQKRDFLYVKDAADMTLFFLDNPTLNGIYNIGSGIAETWNTLIGAVFSAVDMIPTINYIDMPDNIREQYQYYTKAEMEKLFNAGYEEGTTPLTDAVGDYVLNYLISGNHLQL